MYGIRLGGYSDIDLTSINTNFSSLIEMFKSFLSVAMGFFAILPAWMISFISLGFTVAIALRVFGR